MNEYTEKLYRWIENKDNSFSKKLSIEDFANKLDQDEEYATRMYKWISRKDPSFEKKKSLEVFLKQVKKPSSAFIDPLTENLEDAELTPEDVEVEVEEETKEVNIFDPDTQDFTIDKAEVDKETFDEYSGLLEKEKVIKDDPFQNALNQVNSELLTQEEEELAPDLSYRFNKYGFNFNQAVVGRERIRVTSQSINPQTGKPYEIIIKTDQKDEAINAAEAQKLQNFLVQHKVEESRLDKLENNLNKKTRQYQNDEEVSNSFKILNTESEAFNQRVKSYLTERREYLNKKATIDGMSQYELDTPIGKALQIEVENQRVALDREKTDLLAQDVILNNKGVEIDRLVGKYGELNAKKGSFLGATYDSILKGFARISSTGVDYLTDIMTWAEIGKDMKGYEKQFKKRAEELGFYNPQKKQPTFSSFEEFKSSLSVEQQKEIDSYLLDMNRKSIKYDNIIFNEDGSLEFKKIDAAARYSDEYLKKNIKKITEDGVMPLVREGSNIALGNDATSAEYIDLMREGFWGGAWLGLAESLPAMWAPGGKVGWVARTAQMFAQVSDHLNEEMMNDPDFQNISEMEKKAVSLPIGITVGVLEAYGLRNVINSKGALNSIVLSALGKAKGAARTQGLTFRQVVQNEVKNKILRGTLTLGAGGLAEFETGVAQEIADIGGKMIYNKIKEEDLFQTPESLSEGVRQVLYAGAQEAVGGLVMSSIPATTTAFSGKDYTALSDPMFKIFESIHEDPTYFTAYTQLIKNEINQGKINKEEGQQKLDMVETMRSIISKVPQDLNTKDRKKAVALLYNKGQLEKTKQGIDPKLTGKIDNEISKIDNQLELLIEGALEIQGTEGQVKEEEEITDEQAKQYLEEENEARSRLGLGIKLITPELIAETKVELKKEKDASKKQSTVEEISQEQAPSTEEVVEGVPSKVRKPSKPGAVQDQKKITKKQEKEIKEETIVEESQDLESLIKEETGKVTEEGVEVVSENVTKDGKVKITKGNYKMEPTNFKPLKKFATQVTKAISKILPNVKFVLHETSKNFNKATGKRGRGFYNSTAQIIHIDMTKGTNKTIAHEVFHALLLNSIKTNAATRALTKKMVAAVAKAKGLSKAQKQKIDKFIANYDANIQNEEKLAEVLGVLAEGYTKLDAPTKSKVRQWINKIATKLGINIGQFTESDQDVIDLLNTVAQKLRKGETITQKDIKTLKPPKKTQKQKVEKKKEKSKDKYKKDEEVDVIEDREQKEQSIFNKMDTPIQIIKAARVRNFSDAAISNYLQRVKKLKISEIKKLLEVSSDLFTSVPMEFGKAEGGMKVGMQIYEDVDSQLQDFAADKKNKIGDIRAKALELLKNNPLFKKQPKIIQDQMIVAFDRTLQTTANKNIQKEISDIKNRIKENKINNKNLTAAKVEVKNFIRRNLLASKQYSQDKINRLLKIVSDATVNSYPADVEMVLDIVEKQNQIIKKSLIKQMLTLVRKAARKMISKGKARARGLDASGQQFFKDVKEILVAAANNDIEAMILIAEQLSDTEAINEVVLKESRGEKLTSKEESLLNKLLAFDTFGDVLNMDIEQLQILIKDLKNVKTQSILNLKARRLLRAEKYKLLENEATEQIKQNYPNLFDKEGNLKDDNELIQDQNQIWDAFRKLKIWTGLKKWVGRYDYQTVTGFYNWIRNLLAHIGTLTNIIDNVGKGNTFFFDNIYMKLNDMNTNRLEGYENQIKILDKLANAIPGITKGYKQFINKIITGGVINIKINGKNQIFSKDQLIRIYALSKNEIQRKKLADQGFTNNKIKEIENIIGKDAISFVDKVINYFSNEYYESVNDVYKQVNDASLGYVSNYFPTKTLSPKIKAKMLEEGDFSGIFSAETAPALKERTDTQGKVDLNQSFTDVLNEHLLSMERFKAYAEGVKTLNTIFKIPSVNTLLEQTGIKNILKFNLNADINPGGALIENSALDTLMRKFTQYALSFKLIQIAKQATSFINAFEDYSFRKPGSKKILLGIPDAVLDTLGFMLGVAEVIVTLPVQMKKAWSISPDFRHRLTQGLKGDVYGLESGTNRMVPISTSKALQILKVSSASPTILGDIMGVMGYMVNYNQNIRNGMSKADALRAFNLYNATQQTRRGTERSKIQNSSNALTRAFTMFGSTLFLQMNKVASSMSNIYKVTAQGKIPRAKDLRALAINYGIANVLFVTVSNIFKLIRGNEEDEEEVMGKIKEAMMGLNLMFQLPLIGGGIEAVYNKISNKKARPPQDIVNPFTNVFRKISKAMTKEGISFNSMRPLIEIIIGAQADPFIGLYNYFRGEGDPDKNLYDMLGVSPSYQPTKKKKQGKKMTQSELKKHFPKLYEQQQELKEKSKLPPNIQNQLDAIEEEQKRLREEALEKLSN